MFSLSSSTPQVLYSELALTGRQHRITLDILACHEINKHTVRLIVLTSAWPLTRTPVPASLDSIWMKGQMMQLSHQFGNNFDGDITSSVERAWRLHVVVSNRF